MPFRGLTMLKSPKLIIKGGLCYGFAMVLQWDQASSQAQNTSKNDDMENGPIFLFDFSVETGSQHL